MSSSSFKKGPVGHFELVSNSSSLSLPAPNSSRGFYVFLSLSRPEPNISRVLRIWHPLLFLRHGYFIALVFGIGLRNLPDEY